MSEKSKWIVVSVFAIAMAWVESAVVVYLRTLIDRIEPHQANPLPIFGGLANIELGREAATLVMLVSIGWLAGTTWRGRLAYAAIAFGVWDIFYYLFLVPMSGWPRSLFDWDILFLLPLPWWGPVIAPVLISILMIIGGTLIVAFDSPSAPLLPRQFALALASLGTSLALYVFMADALRVANNGVEAIRTTLPTRFDWQLFGVALALMATPIVDLGLQIRSRQQPPKNLVR
ncbi:MAG: hypothetical protein L0Y55_17375 [Anaerolineales bacterium]|nr:hypothetical protein [Anaerolineales bacterium]